MSAFFVRALQDAVGDPARAPRSLTVHFVDAPAAGPVDVAVALEREGRSSSSLSLRMEQDGRPVALALALCSPWREGEPSWAGAAPDAPPPEDCPEVPPTDGAPGFHERLAIRWVRGGAPGRPAEEARNLAWLRLAEGGPLDHLAVTALSDGWLPAAFSKLGRYAIVPTFDLTIHFRAPLPAAGEWLLADYRSRFSAGGAWEEDGELWAQDGTLVAQSRQLAMMRPAPVSVGYLGLGSNVGDRRAMLQAAVDALGDAGVRVLASSSVYETEPVGEVPDQRDFLNACLRVETAFEPEALLKACKAVERRLGRERGGARHGPRAIDVDVLLLGGAAFASPALTLPHPEVTARRFVLVPLLELDPALTLPDGTRLASVRGLPARVELAGPPLRVGRTAAG